MRAVTTSCLHVHDAGRVRCVFGCVRSAPVIVDATEAVTVDRGPQVRITQAPLSGLFQPQKDEIPLRCC